METIEKLINQLPTETQLEVVNTKEVIKIPKKITKANLKEALGNLTNRKNKNTHALYATVNCKRVENRSLSEKLLDKS